MTMTRSLKQLLLVSGLAVSVGLIGSSAIAQTQTFKLGHVDNPATPAGVALDTFAAEVAKLSNNSMTVQVFHAGQLGPIPEQVKNVLSGTQDMHMFSPEIVTNLLDESKIISAPYVFKSNEHLQ